MRYFTFDLISEANDWIEQSESARLKAEQRLQSAIKKYYRELETLEPRMSRDAFRFFRHGFGRKSLHDARLLSVKVGDGLTYVPDGRRPFFLNRQHASAIIEFLNYEQDLHYIFDLRGLRHFTSDLFVEKDSYTKSLGDLYTYELTNAGNDSLRLGFLFASGASIVTEFERLVFRKKRLRRRYEVGEMYE